MDSLLASYASSSSDDDEENPTTTATTTAIACGGATTNFLFSTLSTPKPSLFAVLPPPKPSPFAALPPPKSAAPFSAADQPPKRVVKFIPPIHPSLLNSDDSDDDSKRRKPSTDSSSSTAPGKPFSSVLPAPKNSLCLAPAPSRRSVLQTPSNPTENFTQPPLPAAAIGSGGFGPEPEVSGYGNYGRYSGESYDAASYGCGVAGYGSYGGDWSDGSMAAAVTPDIPEFGRIAGKRGRNVIPTEIVEVNQDELMKNRPREDQTKLTGVAFGPAYQPVSSSKGKPSKLHKRKHQIGSLYFDMKQKEMELSERRSRGLLTKAETHAKYGW